MEIYLPNSAFLGNAESTFARRLEPDDQSNLRIRFHDRWVAVHPMILALTSCAGLLVRSRGGSVTAEVPHIGSLPYLVRMGLFDHLGVDPGIEIEEHEEAGRFVPIAQIQSSRDLSDFVVNVGPLLHAPPFQADAIKYAISELLRNALEHAGSPVGAVACAQYYPRDGRIAIGVADAGVGIRSTMGRFHPTESDLGSIMLALRPGITGTTSRIGGTEYNAGAGLFITKSIAATTRQHIVVYSGSGYFKLRKTPSAEPVVLHGDPAFDRAATLVDVPSWPGTVIGIDIRPQEGTTFGALMRTITDAYSLDLRQQRGTRYRTPRFE